MKLRYPLYRTRVKICGLTRVEDVHAAVSLGADAIGLVFYPPSPRHVEVERAKTLIRDLPPFVTVVGLFVDERPAHIRQILAAVRIDLLQFHGDESPIDCESLGKPWIKALRMKPGLNVIEAMGRYRGASGYLVDAWHPNAVGGTGETFDWSRLPRESANQLILAGGLTPENVSTAIKAVRPYALDVSSGVESDKGIKDAAKMAAFLNNVQRLDYGLQRDRTL